VRAAFLALLLVNLAFLAWAEWIDVPVPPPNAIAHLPRLRLAAGAGARGPDSSAAPITHSLAATTPASQPAGAAFAAQCVSVGPFKSAAAATQATQRLGAGDLSPRQRVVHSPPKRWYWVYLSGPVSTSQTTRMLRRLKADGIKGAKAMSASGKPSISLGMFQDPKLAAHQQHLAQSKGFHPVLADRLVSKPEYWLDIWVPGGAPALPLHALKGGTAVGTEPCPAGEKSPQSAPQAVSPGLPLTQAGVTDGSAHP